VDKRAVIRATVGMEAGSEFRDPPPSPGSGLDVAKPILRSGARINRGLYQN
jgi:hypothetical protein